MMNAAKIILICTLGLSGKTYAAFVPDAAAVLAAHNSIREKVGVPPLVWSDALAQVAQECANKLMSTGQFMHSSDLRYGENLFQISGPGATSNTFQVVNAWACEAALYDYATNTCHGRCGHYTQVVWRDTKQVGCAVAHDSHREIWVCEYAPFGNIIGQKPY